MLKGPSCSGRCTPSAVVFLRASSKAAVLLHASSMAASSSGLQSNKHLHRHVPLPPREFSSCCAPLPSSTTASSSSAVCSVGVSFTEHLLVAGPFAVARRRPSPLSAATTSSTAPQQQQVPPQLQPPPPPSVSTPFRKMCFKTYHFDYPRH
jgi:hypothetical protein